MLDELTLVDTNVLVYAHLEESEHNAACRTLLDQSQNGQQALAVTPQILLEFYTVVTNPQRVTTPFQPIEALDEIDRLLSLPGLALLPTPSDTVTRWIRLARQHPATGATIFDYQIVATMLGNGVTRIYTFDRAHFERFRQLEMLTP